MWAIDNKDLYPTEVSVALGGAMEPAVTNLPFIFQVMSNELSTPKVLACPDDNRRLSATSFSTMASTNISYFVGLDATETNPACILSGDRNITNGMGVRAGILYATTNAPAGWTSAPHKGYGNLLFADGSVQQVSTKRLREAIANTGFQTNRLLMP
jgi:prepilin-type processing-associated H-X9-DG protein